MEDKFLVSRLEGRTLDCPLCEDGLRVVISRNGHPYVACADCGMRMFIAKEAGGRRLLKRINGATTNGRPDRGSRGSGENGDGRRTGSIGTANGDPFVRRSM